ncbi:MAG: hypothetical protein IKO16_05770 [Lachnospiraceae bacterium]|nr:hypothetical protein [Lachnospiraceae bacterium]
MEQVKLEKVLIDKKELMQITGYGRRRAEKFAELAHAKVYIGNSVRYSVEKLRDFARREAL